MNSLIGQCRRCLNRQDGEQRCKEGHNQAKFDPYMGGCPLHEEDPERAGEGKKLVPGMNFASSIHDMMWWLPKISPKNFIIFQQTMRDRAKIVDPTENISKQLTPESAIITMIAMIGQLAEHDSQDGMHFPYHERMQRIQETCVDLANLAMVLHSFFASVKIDFGDGKQESSKNN